jgi:3-methyl-2-oxobutanoate hydroxymethyltransferase
VSVRKTDGRGTAVERDQVTIRNITKRAGDVPRLTMITAYDFYSARFADRAGVDMILVGDSLGPFMLGYPSTVPVTMEEMLHHCRAVSRARPTALVVGDLPFGSYQIDVPDAVANAVRLVKEGGCAAVKLEGGVERAATIAAIVAAGIPVMGHVGLKPQSEHLTGGYRVQGRTAAAAEQLIRDGMAVAAAGCFALVVEAVPRKIAAEVTRRVPVATVGIGAGVACDGQVLIYHEVIGMHTGRAPRYVKQYADVGAQIGDALARYCTEVRTGQFPDREHSYLMARAELTSFRERLQSLDGDSPAAQAAGLDAGAPPPRSVPADAAAGG